MPLAWAGAGLPLGLFLGASFDAPPLALLLLAAATVGAYILARAAGVGVAGPALLALALLAGMARAGPDTLSVGGGLERVHGQRVELLGVVNGLPELVGRQVQFEVRASAVSVDGRSRASTGAVLVRASPAIQPIEGRSHPFIAHGDEVLVVGGIAAPRSQSGFDYEEHLASRGVGSVMTQAVVAEVEPAVGADAMRMLHTARRRLASSLHRHMPEPEAALTAALTLGVRGGLPPDLNDDFRGAGMAHLLAVSGMHVGVLLAVVLAASRRSLGRRRGLYLAAPFVLLWAYVALAGAPPSAVRAGVMGSAYLLALATGRASAPINAVGLAALLILAIEPRSLWDRSFQLSFTSMAGVLLAGVPAARLARLGREPGPPGPLTVRSAGMNGVRWAAAGFLVSLGAVAGSLPLVAFNFGLVPLLGIPATLVVMPLLPILLVSGMLTAVAGLVTPYAGYAVGAIAFVPASVVVWTARLVGGLSWSSVSVGAFGAGWLWVFYGASAAALVAVHRARWAPAARALASAVWRGPPGLVRSTLVVAGLATIAAAPMAVAFRDSSDGLLHAYFLDVGQGDATLLVTPGGGSVLIDGGPDPRRTMSLVDDILSPVDRVVDVAVLTHPHEDHLGGIMELARRGRIAQVLVPPSVDLGGEAWRRELGELSVTLTQGVRGAEVVFSDGVVLEVLHPPDPPLEGSRSDIDNNGLVVRVALKDAAFLFTGDLFADGERVLLDLEPDPSAEALQVGHHGSNTSSSAAFLRAVAPSMAVVSAGADNRFGHPSSDVLDRLSVHVPDGLLFQTIERGTVHITTDGERWWASAERGE